jgi:hypothetical protein
MPASGWLEDPMPAGKDLERPNVQVWIQAQDPLTGIVRADSGEALRFKGWPNLLQALWELLEQRPSHSRSTGRSR